MLKATPLTEEFGVEEFLARYGESLVPLLAITESKRIRMFTADRPVAAVAGETIVALVDEPSKESQPKSRAESSETQAKTEGAKDES